MHKLIYGQHDAATLAQLDTCLRTGSAVAGVLCADGHLGYNHPIGGVVGYSDHISISGVGFDIGCGNLAVKTALPFQDLQPHLGAVLSKIREQISFGVGRVNTSEKVDHELFESDLWKQADVGPLKVLAREQLGTVGSGNHYVDLFEEESSGLTWVGVHFGSRGLGHKITTKYLRLAGAKDTMVDPPALLEATSDLGQAYYAGIQLGGWYAEAGRAWVVNRVLQILATEATDTVSNHHNYCWQEEHFGQKLWVVRKGATPAYPEQRGFVGGSMGDKAVILKGVESDASRASLYSTVHGAGRVMGRLEAKGKKDKATGQYKREPKVDFKEWMAWLAREGVQVLGSDLDEAPQAYRRLPDVLAAHAGTIQVTNVLTPRGVVMAGANEFDPYKD